MDYELNEGDGAFYGPKIDFHLEDSHRPHLAVRHRAAGLPDAAERFEPGVRRTTTARRSVPIMIHRVCFGSVERFIGILIEHYAGKFPVWLAPTQVKVLCVSEKSRDYAHQVAAQLEDAGIRVAVDDRDAKIGYKIREARSIDRVPYMIVVGEKEAEEGNIAVRDRSNETHPFETADFIAKVCEEIRTRA